MNPRGIGALALLGSSLLASCERGNQGLDLGRKDVVLGLDALVGLELTLAGTETFVFDKKQSRAIFRWYREPGAPETLAYIVGCAFPKGKTVRLKGSTSVAWRGRHGLSTNLTKPLDSADDRKWVSACMLAYANQRHSHQYISLRGGAQNLEVGERFTMSYPEGVFFGDLFTDPSRRQRYAMSLNLPLDYDPGTAGWWPPNAALGRQIDFDATDLATYLGQCRATGSLPPKTKNEARLGDTSGTDPVHKQRAACADGKFDPASGCSGRPIYRPLFVYLPRLFNLEDPWEASTGAPDEPANGMSIFASGSPERMACPVESQGAACVGSYDPLLARSGTACGWESTSGWTPSTTPAGVVLLEEGDKLRAVLRASNDAEEIGAGPIGTPFTAIIRFRTGDCGDAPRARNVPLISTRKANGIWAPITASAIWHARHKDSDGGFQWLQVYPVFLLEDDTIPTRRKSLAIEIQGAGPGSDLPKLDAVGFVPGLPSCCEADGPGRPAWCPASGAPVAEVGAGVCPGESLNDSYFP